MICICCNNEMVETGVKLIGKKVYKCNNCGHESIDINETEVLEYHTKYTEHIPRPWLKLNKIAILRDDLLKMIEFDSVYDIGAGNCELLDILKYNGKEIAGIEPEESEITIDEVICGDFMTTKIDEKYDLVMAWHVIEHIRDTDTFLKKMLSISNKYIVLEIPVQRKLNKFTGHVHNFTKNSVNMLLKKYDIDIIYNNEGFQKPARLIIGVKK